MSFGIYLAFTIILKVSIISLKILTRYILLLATSILKTSSLVNNREFV